MRTVVFLLFGCGLATICCCCCCCHAVSWSKRNLAFVCSNDFFKGHQRLQGHNKNKKSSWNWYSSSNDIIMNEAKEEENKEDDETDKIFVMDQPRSLTKMKSSSSRSKSRSSRWHLLSDTAKEQIRKEAHERAIRNKEKREPKSLKKRRLMVRYKESLRRKWKESRIQRLVAPSDRIPLANITAGMELEGIVISLTSFGAYIDVGTECDGLLHISQINNTIFIEHPRQVFSPGDNVTVRVLRTSAELKKMHLTMLPMVHIDPDNNDDDEDPIPLDDLAIDDELWGEIRRVTDYGAYVELGAQVQGFLHFMDHPVWADMPGAHPTEFMKVADRVRVWVSDLDMEKERIKLTANRPLGLPGPRREMPRNWYK